MGKIKRRFPNPLDIAALLKFKAPVWNPTQRRLNAAHTIQDLAKIAKRRTPKAPFDYADGAADSEISLAELGIELDGPYAHPPKYSSVLPVRLAQGLVALALTLVWLARWTLLFTVLKRPYGAAEREYLTVQALEISADDWAYTEDASKEELIKLELWEEDNMDQLRANQRSMQHSGKKRS
jgi:hypothetical protein